MNSAPHPPNQAARRAVMIASAGAAISVASLTMSGSAAAQSAPVPAPVPQANTGRVVMERRGATMLIGIDRPGSQNLLDAPLLIGLAKAYFALEHDDSLRVGVLHGLGPNFCLGLDVPSFTAAVASGVLPVKDPDTINPLGLRPPQRSKPLVVAVQGGTKYVGHELFLASDIRVAASDTVFSQGEVTRGVFPAGGGTIRFTREAGWGNAMRYMLTGEEWGAEEARRLGLLQEITPPGQQLDRAIGIARKIAAAAPLGVRAALASAHQALAADEATAMGLLPAEFARVLRSEDVKEAVQARKDGRAPQFRGL